MLRLRWFSIPSTVKSYFQHQIDIKKIPRQVVDEGLQSLESEIANLNSLVVQQRQMKENLQQLSTGSSAALQMTSKSELVYSGLLRKPEPLVVLENFVEMIGHIFYLIAAAQATNYYYGNTEYGNANFQGNAASSDAATTTADVPVVTTVAAQTTADAQATTDAAAAQTTTVAQAVNNGNNNQATTDAAAAQTTTDAAAQTTTDAAAQTTTDAAAAQATTTDAAAAQATTDAQASTASDASATSSSAASAQTSVAAVANVDSSALPNGIANITQPPTSEFCKQFLPNIPENNGTQLKQGGQSCSSTPMGLVPDLSKMISSLIISPEYGATIDASKNNTVVIKTLNLEAGFFNNPNTQYYLVPATLNKNQILQGHQHVTVEPLVNGNNPLNPRNFTFFKGINDASVDPQKELLSATIPANTLKNDGVYRICTISGTDGHQTPISPVVKRGSQDDCIRINVINSKGGPLNSNVADDSAQNTQITQNGQGTGQSATNDNSGKDAGGGNMNQQMADKNAQIGVDPNAVNGQGAQVIVNGGAGNNNGNTNTVNTNTNTVNTNTNTVNTNTNTVNTNTNTVNTNTNTGNTNTGNTNTNTGNTNTNTNTGNNNANGGNIQVNNGNTNLNGNTNTGNNDKQLLSQLKALVNQMLTVLQGAN
ncbi:hypothetical protein HK103_005469 [Boothiomyces macroporosus]|uniref:Uncharacterized protein n=1 Tax=Boothiomyces macroporosus TaxID=261099 RepID=A0AAD5UJF3_9FUNG|nr:hypothetical protein HK103_005469 [Boothiomyces macroporosus]